MLFLPYCNSLYSIDKKSLQNWACIFIIFYAMLVLDSKFVFLQGTFISRWDEFLRN